MESIIYTNKFGDKIVEKAEAFDFRGTIMSRSHHDVCGHIVCRLWVEDSNGGKSVTIWDSAKGFDLSSLKVGYSVRFKGYVKRQGYCDRNGNGKEYLEYKAQEMSA